MVNRAIFLDRDGVLIEDMHYNCDINKIYINHDLVQILKKLQHQFLFIIITNQSGVARGMFDLQQVENFNIELTKRLQGLGVRIDDIFVCPHYPNGIVEEYSVECNCRKPEIGLILKAKEKYDLCLEQSFLIGDKKSDVMCGNNANLKQSFNISKHRLDWIYEKIKISTNC